MCVLWVLLALAAAATAVWAGRPSAPAYEVARVERGAVRATVHALGTLQPRHYVDVGAQVSGQIQQIHVQAGDTVVPGQLLVEIDASVQQATVDAGRASLDALRAQLDGALAAAVLARADAGRHQRLLRTGATPIQMADATRAELLGAEATVRRIEADIRRTHAALQGDEALLGYSRIYAPIAGTVVSLEARPGQTLNATYQTPKLLRIADLSAMTVWTQVSEADIPRLRVGMEAVFTTLAQDGRQWRGTVRQVLPMPQPDPAAAEGGTATQPAVGAKAWRAAWRAMALNRVRTALTLLGIVAGAASVIVMLAIGRGAKEQVVRQMGALGAAILYVSGGVAPEGGVAGVVLGSRLRQRLLPDVDDPIGQLVLIDATPFEVIGVMSAKGAESGSAS